MHRDCMSRAFRERLVQVAIEKGYLDEEQAREAYRLIESGEASDPGRRFQDVLVERRLLTRDQIIAVRRAMAKEGMAPRIGDFEIISRLGRGTSGVVYRARQRSLGREVALKLLSSHLAADAEFVRRFFREARTAACVSHPNVVQVYDVGQTRHTHYIVMEYVPGVTLERLIETEGRIPPERVLSIARQIARALAHIESCGMVHRDIKPGNIMMTATGQAKLADLGLALRPGDTPEGGAGTPFYMPPEQVAGWRRTDIRSDIYALGCTLFHAATGVPPYRGRTVVETVSMHASAPIPDARSIVPSLPAGLASLLARMMAKRPEDRFASAVELCEALDRLGEDAAASRHTGSTLDRGSSLTRWLWAGFGAAIVVALCIVFIALRQGILRRAPGAPDAPSIHYRLVPRGSDTTIQHSLPRLRQTHEARRGPTPDAIEGEAR